VLSVGKLGYHSVSNFRIRFTRPKVFRSYSFRSLLTLIGDVAYFRNDTANSHCYQRYRLNAAFKSAYLQLKLPPFVPGSN
jgi:hypothetical protein